MQTNRLSIQSENCLGKGNSTIALLALGSWGAFKSLFKVSKAITINGAMDSSQ